MEFLPILLGGDLNCYGMALAFYSAGIYPSISLGRLRLGVTSWSRIVCNVVDRRMESDCGRLAIIHEIVAKNPKKCPILIGCTDEYASFLIRRRGDLPGGCVVPSPQKAHLKFADKSIFYEACRARGLHVPSTLVLHTGEILPRSLPFEYPIVLKPAKSEEYWHHPFEGMRKVWFPAQRGEALDIIDRMRMAGYRGAIIVQERLRVMDSDNYVLTAYSNRYGRVVGAGFGRVLLEEHTPKGLGNHAAILSMPIPDIGRRVLSMLDDIGYCGFSNFDFLKPANDDYYLLEMNLRQGRSNHYLTASGLNPAELILADYIGGVRLPFYGCRPNVFWHSVPPGVVYSHLRDDALLRHLKELEVAGRSVSPFHTGAEGGGILRRMYVHFHEQRVRARADRYADE